MASGINGPKGESSGHEDCLGKINPGVNSSLDNTLHLYPDSPDDKGSSAGIDGGKAQYDHQNDPVKAQSEDAIAVIGMAVRFPGSATSTEAFWQMLLKRQSALSDVPTDRFNLEAFYNADTSEPGTLNARGAHFVQGNLASFDAPFFSISPAEAECMDPQQRWLLETTYHALENAGLSLEDVTSSKTSVHVGAFMHEYETMLSRDLESHVQYKATGASLAMLANRISWFYDFTGPSLVIDTACSSSLNALDLACQSIRNGNSSMGVVAGCNLMLNPDSSAALADLGFMSPDSKCYSFDHRANGYARGEGAAAVIIKPLSLALQNKDTVRAVIRAASSNQDGRTPGVSQPSSKAHEALIRQTYLSAGLDMSLTNFFEAHGTGTPVGDPIEALAIHLAFKERPRLHPLRIGAVKTNIGHLEGAAGLAGLIKAILVVEKGIIPPNVWFEEANPSIKSLEWNFEFPVKPVYWPTSGLRRASVSSFGFGGSNCHVVLDDAYSYLRMCQLRGKHCTKREIIEGGDVRDPQEKYSTATQLKPAYNGYSKLLVWSAWDEQGLERVRKEYEMHLNNLHGVTDEGQFLQNLAFTLAKRRTHLPWRVFTIADSIAQLKQSLNGEIATPTRSVLKPNVTFVFTGQGAEWVGMGLELMSYPAFEKSLEVTQAILLDLGCTWDLLDEMTKEASCSNLHDPAYSQPISTALQIALVALLHDWGVKPRYVIGHSSGEIAAAYCAGAISHYSALKIAYYRGLVVSAVPKEGCQRGAMMAAGLNEKDATSYLRKISPDSKLSIACFNSPHNVTFSGPEYLIDALESLLCMDGIFCRKLKVKAAYHTTAMKELTTVYSSYIGVIPRGSPNDGNVTMVSSLTGQECSSEELRDPDYWTQNLASPVKFFQAVHHLVVSRQAHPHSEKATKNHVDHVCEIGPHGALRGAIIDILKDASPSHRVSYSSLLSKGKSALNTVIEAAGMLHCMGSQIDIMKTDFTVSDTESLDMLTDLPGYPFDHSKAYWNESRISRNIRFRKVPTHELLGTPVPDWNPSEPRWSNRLRLTKLPWVNQHKVNDTALYPAAGYIIMAIEAARQIASTPQKVVNYHLRDVVYRQAVMVPQRGVVEVQIVLRRSDEASGNFMRWSDFRIYRCGDRDSAEVGRGSVALEYETDESISIDMNGKKQGSIIQTREQVRFSEGCKLAVTSKQFYDVLRQSGLSYGSSFQCLKDIRHDNRDDAVAQVCLHSWTSKLSTTLQPSIIHPGALDSILQMALVSMTKGGRETISTMVPTKFARLKISADLYDCKESSINVSARRKSVGIRTADVTLTASSHGSGKVTFYCDVEAKRVTESNPSSSMDQLVPKRLCYNIDWKPDLDSMTKEQIESYCSPLSTTSVDATHLMLPERDDLCRLALYEVKKKIVEQDVRSRGPHFGRYIDWMNHIVLSDEFKLSIGASDESRSLESLQIQIENIDPASKLLVHVSRDLQNVLEGKIDGLQVLYENGLADDYYRYLNQSAKSFHSLRLFIDLLAHKNPNLSFLEIGAGTGSATRDVLQTLTQTHLKRFKEYTFTDISASFFENAKDEFRDYIDRMTFSLLDIERDPSQQGFVDEYDVVIASNVLHATASLRNTLQNAQRLLRRGGRLIIYEAVDPHSITSPFSFGLLPGWWRGTEDFRKWGPIVDERTWDHFLRETGFSGIDVSFQDSYSNSPAKASLMISTYLDEPMKDSSHPQIIILEDRNLNGQESGEVSKSVFQQLRRSFVEKFDVECNVLSHSNFTSKDLDNTICVLFTSSLSTGILELSESGHANLQKLIGSAAGLLWAFQTSSENRSNPVSETIIGLLRCIKSEYERLKAVSIRLPAALPEHSVVEEITMLLHHMFLSQGDDLELEWSVGDLGAKIPRLVEAQDVNQFVYSKTSTPATKAYAFGNAPTKYLKMEIAKPGLLESLRFIHDPAAAQPIASDEVEVEVKAAGINFHDVLLALGQLESGSIGMDCAGVITQAGPESNMRIGDRVVCIVSGAYQTRARCKAATVCQIPCDMSFAIAAALPTPFLTAYYSLIEVARIRARETVLIHSAAGGTGQACIQIAKLYDADIYATVGTKEKKKVLQETYGIPEDHIFSSRAPSFVSGIQAMTNNRGVDIVINSLTGEALRNTWEGCLAPFGRFIEIGKKDIAALGQLPMATFAKNATFACVDMTMHYAEFPKLIGSLLERILDLFRNGKVGAQKPLEIFNLSHIEAAFRSMQSGKNKGKMVVRFDKEDLVSTVTSPPPHYFDPNATYVIAGGLGGLGRSIARWMASHKARNLILLGSSTSQSEAAKILIEELKVLGVYTATPPCDISDRVALARTLSDCCEKMPPIKGCVQGAMVLRDETFAKMSYENFHAAIRPKVQGSWNLHALLPKKMDFFVLLSSMAGIVGNYGQSNYAAGNTYQDALARYRVANGEKAISIDLGGIKGIGYIAELDDPATALGTNTYTSINEAELMALMEYYCDPELQLSVDNCQIATGIETAASLRRMKMSEPLYMTRAIFSQLYAIEDDSGNGPTDGTSADNGNTVVDYHTALSTAESLDAAGLKVSEGLSKRLASMMALEIENVDADRPFHTFGVDSLGAVEIRAWLSRTIKADVAVFEILSSMSIDEISRLAAERSEFVRGELREVEN